MQMNEYLLFAQKLVNKFGTVQMKKSEDCISDVATKLMEAYYMYDPNYIGNSAKSSRRGFMAAYGRKAIEFMKLRKVKPKISLNLGFDIEDTKENHDEEIADIFDKVNKMALSDRDKEIFHKMYEGYTYDELGKKYGVSKQRIEQIYSKIIDKVRQSYGNELY